MAAAACAAVLDADALLTGSLPEIWRWPKAEQAQKEAPRNG